MAGTGQVDRSNALPHPHTALRSLTHARAHTFEEVNTAPNILATVMTKIHQDLRNTQPDRPTRLCASNDFLKKLRPMGTSSVVFAALRRPHRYTVIAS